MKHLFLCFLLSVCASHALADSFYADVLGGPYTNTVNSGSKTTTVLLSDITTGIPTHVKLYYRCNVLGVNAFADTKLDFFNSVGGLIMSIRGCDLGGVNNGESTQTGSDKIIPIPVGTVSMNLFGRMYGEVSTSGNVANSSVTFLGRLHPAGVPVNGIDFNAVNFFSLNSHNGTPQNIDNSYQIEDGGATLHISDNTWVAVDVPYTITSTTVLEFEYYSDVRGEQHAIAFTSSLDQPQNRGFLLHGTQYNNYAASNLLFRTYDSLETWVTFQIPVGNFFTGDFTHLSFINDNDGVLANGKSKFRNVKIYEN